MYTLERFWEELEAWSTSPLNSTEARGPAGPLRDLIKEAGEALGQPQDLTEYADCLFLVFDATRRAGFSFDQLVGACQAKLEVSKDQWGPPPIGDRPVKHVREGL